MKSVLLNSIPTTIIAIVFSLIFQPGTLKAQGQNALYFDGIDDEVQVPSASALIASSNQLSITVWVFADRSNAAWPSYDGIAGFRNDLDADFYLVRYGIDRMEARFRNSSGIAYTLLDSTFQSNAWVHYAFTYDGSMARLYKNGVEVGSIAATGNIASQMEIFHVGNLIYSGNNFRLSGMADEVSLWNKALSASEVSCIYQGTIDPQRLGLRLYYQFNQGIAGGINLTTDTLIDASGNLNGNLLNFALNGLNSNWVSGIVNYTQFSASICQGEQYSFAGQNFNTTGIYPGLLPSANSCDSLVLLNLQVTSVDVSVTTGANILTANAAVANYQWIDCDNGNIPLPGETNQTFSSVNSGNFGVIVTVGTCTDTSVCYHLFGVGVEENYFANGIHLHPIPVVDQLIIDLDNHMQTLFIRITDMEGREILREEHRDIRQLKLEASEWNAGVYFLEINSEEKSTTLRLMKN